MGLGLPTQRLAGPPRMQDFALALLTAGIAVMCRVALQKLAPDLGPYIILFPAIAVAGMYWGTTPAILAAACGGAATIALAVQPGLAARPLPLLDTLLYVPASAAIIWVTRAMRHGAAKAEQAEARLAQVFCQFPGAAAILEAPSGRLLLHSDQSEAILGHPSHNLETVRDMARYGGVHADGRPYAPEDYPIARAFTSGAYVRAEPLRYLRPDGSVIDLEVHAGPVKSPDGRIVAAIGMALDVTERVAAERALRDSEAACRTTAERLRAAVDAGGLGIWEIDIATDRMHIDASMAAMLGLPPQKLELSREDMRAFIHPDDTSAVLANLEKSIRDGGAYAEECRIRTRQGRVRWVVSRGAALRDMQKVVGIISDITEQREREEALRQALAARDILMREADHRIKNSLQLVVSLLGLQCGKAQNAETRHALTEALTRVDAIANAHRALERSADLRSIDIDGMMGDLCRRVGALSADVRMMCSAATGLQVDAEIAIPLGLIASEVLTNALRHAFPPGAPGIVSVNVDSSAGYLEVSIADGGKGLPATPQRTGLGSAVVAALARQIGATVNTASQPGAGVTVTVRLALPGAAEISAPLRVAVGA
jgi:PAS domain S-box-containing protein